MNFTVGRNEPLPLKTILSSNVVTVAVDSQLKSALSMMRAQSISSVVVVDADGRAQGIFTEQDAIRLIAERKSVSELLMADVMSGPPVKVLPNVGYTVAYQLMLEKRVRHLIVVDEEGGLLGLVSEGDFLQHMGMEYLVELKTVSSAMSTHVRSIDRRTSLNEASCLMAKHHISCLVVTHDGQPQGILTERDMVRVALEEKDSSKTPVSEEMSHPLITVTPEEPLQQVALTMEERGIRRVVVEGGQGELLGVLTRHDIAKALQGSYVEFLQETLQRQTRELQQNETLLREIEQKVFYQDLIEQVSDAIFIIDADDTRVLDANEQAAVGLGVSQELLLSSRIIDFVHGAPSVERWLEKNVSALRQSGHMVHEAEFVRSNGEAFPVEVNARLIKYLEKDYIVAVARDLTDRMKAVATLKASEQRFQALFQNAPLAYQSLNLDGQIQVVNKAWLKVVGCSEEDAIGHHFSEFITRSSIDTLNKEFPRFVDRKVVDGPLFEVVQKSGDIRLLEVNGQIAEDPQTGELRTHCLLTDVTGSKEAELALRKSEERFRQLFMQSPMPMAFMSHVGELISLNSEFINVYGYEPKDIPTLELWFETAHPDVSYRDEVRVRWTSYMEQAPSNGGHIPADEYFVCCKNGSTKQVVASGLTTDQGVMVMLEDVTEQRRVSAELESSARTYDGIISTSLDGFWVVTPDCAIVDVNSRYCEMSGYSRDEVLQMRVYDLDALQDKSMCQLSVASIIDAGAARFISQHRRKDGSVFDVEANVTYWPEGEGRFFAFIRDVTVELKNEVRLRQSAAVFKNTSEGVMVTDTAGIIKMVNPAFCRLTGYTEIEVLGRDASVIQSGHHDRLFYEKMWQSIREQGYWQGEVWNRRKDGSTYPELLSISEVKADLGEVTHYVGVFADISRLKESEQKLAYLAHHDQLTDLPNRLMMQVRMEQALGNAKRQGSHLAVLLMDLDRFKNVNDSYGHAAGDELLRMVAQVLKNRLRDVDIVCRLGGDEFAILLDDIQHNEDAGRVASEMIEELSRSWLLSNGVEVSIGATIGISIYPDQGDTPEILLQQADTALYRAKNKGRGRFHYFTEELTLEARNRLDVEANLRRAISENELQVYYQPQVDVVDGRIVGAEALVRWLHPEKGMIMPLDFIPVAEQTGLINEIGHFVLQETCRQGTQWLREGYSPLMLAVNLSTVQISQHGLLDGIKRVIEETGYPADFLELEITESALMAHEGRASHLLEELSGLGVRFAIDDFGTGYSSLAYLKKFPVDVLKIDKSFVDDIPHDLDDMTIASTIVAMGHGLGLQIIAEGVEAKEQLGFMRDIQCDLYQGYLKSKPVAADEFEKLLEE